MLPSDGSAEELSVIEFSAPDGSKFIGLLKEWEGDFAVMDFNHPLAGKTIRFEVEVIGIL
jgi:FKBP-type peptidyl-prolyl cis-trans isomerase SlpA